MAIEVRIELDSVGASGKRLTTWVLKYHRYIHAELMTHRVFSRNAASTRAIPSWKFRKAVEEDPAIPVHWGKHQSGMQAEGELEGEQRREAEQVWREAALMAVGAHTELERLGLHKQVANRILEPWQWMTTVVTATEFGGWFKLRNHRDAQPEIKELARQMVELYRASTPRALGFGDWHMPFLPDLGDLLEAGHRAHDLLKISTGRVARVSYLNHDGVREPAKDVELHDRLLKVARDDDPPHMSPFEHVAQALSVNAWNTHMKALLRQSEEAGICFNPMQMGNAVGWLQYRKWLAMERGVNESGFDFDWRKQG